MAENAENQLTCPVCLSVATNDAPHLTLMQCQCTGCGWYFSRERSADVRTEAVRALVQDVIQEKAIAPCNCIPPLGSFAGLPGCDKCTPKHDRRAAVQTIRELLLSLALLDAEDAEALVYAVHGSEPSHGDYQMQARQVRKVGEQLQLWWELANGRDLN